MSLSFDDYRARGFSPAAAAYFSSGRQKILSVSPRDDFSLLLHFSGGETRVLHVAPLIRTGSVFAPLADPALFRSVCLDDQSAVSWPSAPAPIDLDPDACYLDSIPADAP